MKKYFPIKKNEFFDLFFQKGGVDLSHTFSSLFSNSVQAYIEGNNSDKPRVFFLKNNPIASLFFGTEDRDFGRTIKKHLIKSIKEKAVRGCDFRNAFLKLLLEQGNTKRGDYHLFAFQRLFYAFSPLVCLEVPHRNAILISEFSFSSMLEADTLNNIAREMLQECKSNKESLMSLLTRYCHLLCSHLSISIFKNKEQSGLLIDFCKREYAFYSHSCKKDVFPTFSSIWNNFECLNGGQSPVFFEMGASIIGAISMLCSNAPFLKDITCQDAVFLPFSTEQLDRENIYSIRDLAERIAGESKYNLNRLSFGLAISFLYELGNIQDREADKLFNFALSLVKRGEYYFNTYDFEIVYPNPFGGGDVIFFPLTDLVSTYFLQMCLPSIKKKQSIGGEGAGGEEAHYFLNLLSDYRKMSKELGLPIKIHFTSINSLKRKHDEVNRLFLENKKRDLSDKCFVDELFLSRTSAEMELITNEKRLFDEGEKQKHCVYSYIPSILEGICLIYSYLYGGERWTIELSLEYEDSVLSSICIAQIRGESNKEADDLVFESAMSKLQALYEDMGITIEKSEFLDFSQENFVFAKCEE